MSASSSVVTGMFGSYSNRSPTLVPRQALLFFASKDGGGFGGETLVATSHPLTQSANSPSPVIGAGHLLSDSDTKEILESLLDIIPTHTGFIPSDVLSMSSNHIAWTVKGSVRPMFFRLRGSTKTIKLNVPMPNLLFVAHADGLSVSAFKGSRRPTENTALFHAPLMNIYRDAKVCLGSASMPEHLTLDTRKEMEDIIFNTNYSHINHDKTLSLKKTISDKQHMAFWRKLHKDKATRFPNTALAPLGCSVEQLINKVVKS